MINEQEVCRLYKNDKLSIRKLGLMYKRSNAYIKKILVDNNVEINHKNRNKYIMTTEHKRKIGEKSKGRKSRLGMKASDLQRRKNMIGHLKRNITLKDIEKYNNTDKLIFLNNVIGRHRKDFKDDKKYIEYLDKFFYNDVFDKIYQEWLDSGKCKWRMPSLEHILPISRGGTFELNNLTFTTWFENRAKAEMTLYEWSNFKKDTGTQSNLFYL